MDCLKKLGEIKPVHASQIKNSPIGLGFEKLDRGIFDPENAYDKVGELGVKWVRIQSGWARTEKEKGVYDFSWFDSIVDNLSARGIEPWVCLCYGNGLYNEMAAKVFGAVGCPPINTEEEKQAWHNYVANLTARYRGKVRWYEIWNEPDGKCFWKHGVDGREYGEFVKATAAAIHEGDPDARVIGGSTCVRKLDWLHDVFSTGAAECMDALAYHAYSPDEHNSFNRIRALRAICQSYSPKIELIQGETGCPSRGDGNGAGEMGHAAWSQVKQAKYLARHMMADLLDDVKFASYFSCLDMAEAVGGVVGNPTSYQDYGYFGVLSANFDANGIANGNYTPKLSYRTLQVISAIFREDFKLMELPVDFMVAQHSTRLQRNDDEGKTLISGGFRRPDGSAAFVYWKPTELLTTSYEATVSLEAAALPGQIKLIDLYDGAVYELPEQMVEGNGRGHFKLHSIPLRDYPLVITFGDFALDG